MKYIRTISGVYKTEKYCEITKITKIYDSTFYTKDIREGDLIVNIEGNYEKIIKEADTIIDLCDGVLSEEKENNNWFILKVEEFKIMRLEDKRMVKSYNFKAFIKTDKGLIYVAKLNSKGEFELI